MLKLYYAILSPVARRVRLALLEKQIAFEPVLLNLNGDQFQPEFLELNPFNHVPVLVDNGFRVVESLAILDYLEAKYPAPVLLPKEPKELAIVRMVQMVTANELFPQTIPLIYENENSPNFTKAKQHISKVLQFFTQVLGDNLYFGSKHLTLADIVAGTVVPLLPNLGINLNDYPTLDNWCRRLIQREAWQKTEVSTEDFEQFKRKVRVLVKSRQREMSWGNKD
jgi:glutathione S-transferase